jgi:hypothetical protein
MASLYDEKVLGAKDRIALARKLQEQSANQQAGQMVSGWYVPNTGGAALGALQNIIGAYQESSAREDLDKAEREKTAAITQMFNSAGIRVPEEMALAAGTPAKDPSIMARLGALVRLEDQPQTIPAKPLEQNVAQNVSPDQFEQLAPAMALTSPELAPAITSIANNRYTRSTQKELAEALRTDKREQFNISEEGRNERAKEAKLLRETIANQGNETQKSIAQLAAATRQNQGGNQSHFVSAGTDSYTGEHLALNTQTGQYFKTGPNGALIPIGGASTPPPTGAVPPPANVPTGAMPPPTGAVPPPTGAVPPPTGAPPQQPNGAMGGPSAPRLYSPEQNATFSQMYKNQLSGINPRVSTKIQPAYLQWQKDNGIDPSDIVGGTAEAKSRAKTALDYTTSGNSGKNIMRIATAVQHIDVLKDAYKALENGDIPAANSIFNRIAQERGMAPQTSFGATAQMVAPEITAAVLASGGASALGDRQDYKAMLNGNMTPAQFKGLTQAFDSLFGGRVKTLATEYKLGTGKDFNYAGHNLSRFAPKEETPAGTPPPAGQGGWSIRRKGQ